MQAGAGRGGEEGGVVLVVAAVAAWSAGYPSAAPAGSGRREERFHGRDGRRGILHVMPSREKKREKEGEKERDMERRREEPASWRPGDRESRFFSPSRFHITGKRVKQIDF